MAKSTLTLFIGNVKALGLFILLKIIWIGFRPSESPMGSPGFVPCARGFGDNHFDSRLHKVS
jgi:hypothetical protein